MITLNDVGKISPIFLTVLLIVYLMLVELGQKKIRRALIPLVVVLMIIFLIVAIGDIISKL